MRGKWGGGERGEGGSEGERREWGGRLVRGEWGGGGETDTTTTTDGPELIGSEL